MLSWLLKEEGTISRLGKLLSLTPVTVSGVVFTSEKGSAWQGEFETAVITALTDRLALKASFPLRYSDEPPIGFEEPNTTTAPSLVFSF